MIVNWDKINDEYLIVLKKNRNGQLCLDYENIVYPLKKEVQQLIDICNKQDDSVDELTEYIKKTQILNELFGSYSYCEKLSGTFQEFTGKKNEIVLKKIRKESDKIEEKNRIYKKNKETKKIYFKPLKTKIGLQYVLWEKGYSIKKLYKKCIIQENILSYSHRISGWSDKPFNLNKDFSFQFNTNFGFGNSSYFYVTLKFKGIYITPFSDWINYDFVRLSEVKRYSKCFGKRIPREGFNGENKRRYTPVLENSDWFDSMEYVKESFNLYLENETKFIEKYIINECERMIEGLERITNNDINLKDENEKRYNFDIQGHYLMEFKGEKISGSLEFINRILGYKKLLTIEHFISKIESFNKTIKPILKNELEIITKELKGLNIEFEKLEQELERVNKEFKEYEKKKLKIKRKISKSNNIIMYNIDMKPVIKKTKKKYPEYESFIEYYNKVKNNHKILKEKIKNLGIILKNIENYYQNIENYFLVK